MVGDDSSADNSTGQALRCHEDGSIKDSDQDDIVDDGQPDAFASGRFPNRHRTPRDLFVAEPASQCAAAALSLENDSLEKAMAAEIVESVPGLENLALTSHPLFLNRGPHLRW